MPPIEEPSCHQFLSDTPPWFREHFEPFERAHQQAGKPAPTQPVTDGALTYLPGIAVPPSELWSAFGVVSILAGLGVGLLGVLSSPSGSPATGRIVLAGGLAVLGVVFLLVGRSARRPNPDHVVRMGIYLVPDGLVFVHGDRFGVYPRSSIHAFTKHRSQTTGPDHRPRSVTAETMYLAEGRHIRLRPHEDPGLRKRLHAWLSTEP